MTTDPIDLPQHHQVVADDVAGAVVAFVGVIRNHDHGRSVERIDYTAHPSAEIVLQQVAEEVCRSYPVDAVAVTHRVGPVQIGESALVVTVSAAHRREAFEACEQVVELVKARLPVWKHQFFRDGTSEWVNCP